ncbi:MAG: protein YgfX [Gallionella sp.]
MPGAIASQLPVKPSLRFAVLLLFLHMMAAIVVFATAVALPVQLLLFMLVAISLIYYLARDVVLLLPGSWREISLNQNEVSVIVRTGSGFVGRVAPRTLVSPYFIVLCVQLGGHNRTISRVIFPDSMGPGVFRELCIHLKFA